MKLKNIIFGMLLVIISTTTILLNINGLINLSLILTILVGIILIFWAKIINNNYTNITVLFFSFSMLYGVSGLINAVWGEGLYYLFSKPYQINSFIISYNIANIGLIFGAILFSLTSKRSNYNNGTNIELFENLKKMKFKLYRISIFLAFIASFSEIINLLRIGGINILFSGKATYQSLSSELTVTLPSADFMIIAFSFFGLFLGIVYKERLSLISVKLKIIKFVLTSSPYIILNIILGQRGILLTLFIGILIGTTYYNPIENIKPKLISIIIVFYIFLAFLFANRSNMYLIKEDFFDFIEVAFEKEKIIEALNPGGSEFGAAFGNYSEFYLKYGNDFEPKLGETYVKGLVMSIPAIVYPGEKPKQITYEFRDEFFISEASRGRIAGTAFSSILEAYMNFKYIGVFLVYFFIGFLLQIIDKKYKYRNLLYSVMYTSLISTTIIFHRSSFGDVFSIFVLRTIIIIFVMMLFRVNFLNFKKNKKYRF